MVKHKEIGRRDIFTKNIIEKAQNDIDFIPSMMNQRVFEVQKKQSAVCGTEGDGENTDYPLGMIPRKTT